MNDTAAIPKKDFDPLEGYWIECPLCYKVRKVDDRFKACPSPRDSTSGRLVFYHTDCFYKMFGYRK